MTDRELLESLGYSVRHDGQGHYQLENGAGFNDSIHGFSMKENAWNSKDFSDPAFWLELDDALAERGFSTSLLNRRKDFRGAEWNQYMYEAYDNAGQREATGKTRLEAVRSVYEQVVKEASV